MKKLSALLLVVACGGSSTTAPVTQPPSIPTPPVATTLGGTYVLTTVDGAATPVLLRTDVYGGWDTPVPVGTVPNHCGTGPDFTCIPPTIDTVRVYLVGLTMSFSDSARLTFNYQGVHTCCREVTLDDTWAYQKLVVPTTDLVQALGQGTNIEAYIRSGSQLQLQNVCPNCVGTLTSADIEIMLSGTNWLATVVPLDEHDENGFTASRVYTIPGNNALDFKRQ